MAAEELENKIENTAEEAEDIIDNEELPEGDEADTDDESEDDDSFIADGDDSDDGESDDDSDDEWLNDSEDDSEELPTDNDDENDSAEYDNDGNYVSNEEQEAEQIPAEPRKETEDGNRDNHKEDVGTDFVRNNVPAEFVPGTAEFFDAATDDAKREVERVTGEEFDEFNPGHMARFNYFFNKAATSREESMKKQVEEAKERQRVDANQQNLNSFLRANLHTKEEVDAYYEALDNLTKKKEREINAQIDRGDLSGVQEIINTLGFIKQKKQTPRYANQKPVSQNNKGGRRVLLASDLFR